MRRLPTTILALSLAAAASPAAASHTPSGTTASVDARTVIAGVTGRTFQITVTHDAGTPVLGPPPINHITVSAPPGGLISLTGGEAAGWTSQLLGGGSVLFTGGAVAPGASTTFALTADVGRPVNDTCGVWAVRVSADGGQTSTAAVQSSSGALRTCVKVLFITDLRLQDPAAADGSVTRGQTVCAIVEVGNESNETKEVDPSLVSSQAQIQKGCGFGGPGGYPGDPLPQPIPSGGRGLYTFRVTFPTVGTAVLTASTDQIVIIQDGESSGDATTGNDETTRSISVQVQPSATVTHVANSLTPRAVVPGQTVSFRLQVTKGPAGSPGLTFDRWSSRLDVADCSTALAAPVTIGTGSQTALLEFEPCTITAPEGGYDANLFLAWVDENGAGGSSGPTNVGRVKVDISAPVIVVSISTGIDQFGDEPPATNGRPISIMGSIRDRNESGALVPCGPPDCVIVHAGLHQYATPYCSEFIGEIPVTPSNSGGNLGGSISATFDPRTRCVVLHIVARDSAGIEAEGLSNALQVDLDPPRIASATIVADPLTRNSSRVIVRFSELVCTGSSRVVDWQPIPISITSQAGGCGGQVTLDFALPFGDEDPSGTLSYAPLPGGQRYRDRAGLEMADQTVAMRDGIAPLAPAITTVDGKGPENGSFLTNRQTVSFVVTNPPETDSAVRAGYLIRLYAEGNGEPGLQPTSDTSLCQGVAEGPTIEVECLLLFQDGPLTIYVTSTDPSGNVSPVTTVMVVIDRTAPRVASVTVEGKTVTVRFSEPLADGRDASPDWRVFGTHPERGAMEFTVSGVEPGPTADVRTVTFTYPKGDLEVTVTEVRYEFAGPAHRRYVDRAGNALPDWTWSLS